MNQNFYKRHPELRKSELNPNEANVPSKHKSHVGRSKKPSNNSYLYYRKINIPYLSTSKRTYYKKEKWRRINIKRLFTVNDIFDGNRLANDVEEYLGYCHRKKFTDGTYEFKVGDISKVIKLIKIREISYIIQTGEI